MGTRRFAGTGSLTGGLAGLMSAAVVVSAAVAGGGPAAAAARPGAARAPQKGPAAGTISTVAGGVGGPARATRVALSPCGVSSGGGSVYIGAGDSVRRVGAKAGWLTTPAGTGAGRGPFVTGGPAAASTLFLACATAVDHSGNLVIADGGLIAVVAGRDGRFYGQPMTARHIYTVAGGGTAGYRTGVPATSVGLTIPGGVAVDASGNLVLAESSTQACGTCPDYASVIQVVAVSSGRFYGQAMTAGDIYTIGGGRGLDNVGGDGGPARKAGLGYQLGDVRLDQAGNVVFDQWDNGTVRVIAARTGSYYGQAMTAGHIYTIAGDGTDGYAGDGGPARRAELNGPLGLAFDHAGNLLIADTGNNRVRAVAARAGSFWGLHMAAGDIYTIAGDGTAGFSGDGGPAPGADLSGPDNVALDGAGNLVVSDAGNNRIRVVAARTGTGYRQAMTAYHIYTIAGNGSSGFSGMGGPATAAELGPPGLETGPTGLATDAAGNLVISADNRVLVTAGKTGTSYGQAMTARHIYTVAGNGTDGFSGDGGPALSAELSNPSGVATDGNGNLLIADAGNNRIRAVAAKTGTFYGQAVTAGHIYTVAGNGAAGYNGDGGPAASAELNGLFGLGVGADGNGNLLIADAGNQRIRVVADKTGTFYGQAMTAGHIYTVAGNGTAGYNGDGGPATAAELWDAFGVAADAAGNLLIADILNQRIRVVADKTGTFYGQAMTAGHIYTVAGNGTEGYNGDGGPATSAEVNYPDGVATDTAGNLLIADTSNLRIRKVAG
jgi:hypothetical protein